MPFKSTAQVRKCFAMKAKGEAGSWDCEKWAHETPNMKKLPHHKGASPHKGTLYAHKARCGVK
jgi:hypothetical protein